MNQNFIFFPCLALMILSGIVLLRMFYTRVMAVKNKNIEVKYFKTYDIDVTAPRLMTQASRNFTNLFEVPTLFYMVCAFALITANVDEVFYTCAWIYVALRCIHSMIHVTTNKVFPRMSVYGLSWIILMYMGGLLAYRILLKV